MIERVEKEVDLLDRHVQVLMMVIEHEPIGIIAMANKTGEPHHKVRYSFGVLEEADLIEPSSEGTITTDQTEPFLDDLTTRLSAISATLDGLKLNERTDTTP